MFLFLSLFPDYDILSDFTGYIIDFSVLYQYIKIQLDCMNLQLDIIHLG